ncbi:glucooligosaccharide oxidase [Apiospora hydei]|uniref:Glucooligosaccharide oxidase n=1 Tax=Apiospora hydei TaxID=1337664 RepID=A0ABR1UW49_9PEZI
MFATTAKVTKSVKNHSKCGESYCETMVADLHIMTDLDHSDAQMTERIALSDIITAQMDPATARQPIMIDGRIIVCNISNWAKEKGLAKAILEVPTPVTTRVVAYAGAMQYSAAAKDGDGQHAADENIAEASGPYGILQIEPKTSIITTQAETQSADPRTKLKRHAGTQTYINYADANLDQGTAQRLYYGVNLPKLQELKAKYDPEERFWYPQSIRPV